MINTFLTSSLAAAATVSQPASAQRDTAAVEAAVEEAASAAQAAAVGVPAVEVATPPSPPTIQIVPTVQPVQAHGYTRPRANDAVHRWVTAADYPPASFLAKEEGYVGYELKVDADGKPTSCEIVEPIEFPALNAATCPAVMKRANFTPATDADQNPIASVYRGGARWRARANDTPEDMYMEMRYLVDVNGDAQNCEVVEARGEIPRDFTKDGMCRGFGNRGRPFRDENGVAVPKVVTFQIGSKVVDPE